jgi:hypothetical protein
MMASVEDRLNDMSGGENNVMKSMVVQGQVLTLILDIAKY